jgi:hypothetical protein
MPKPPDPGPGERVTEVIPLDREPYRVAEKDAVKVAAYRLKRWGIEDDGVLVERVRSETAATRGAGQ